MQTERTDIMVCAFLSFFLLFGGVFLAPNEEIGAQLFIAAGLFAIASEVSDYRKD